MRYLVIIALLLSFCAAMIEWDGAVLVSKNGPSISSVSSCADHSESGPTDHSAFPCASSHCHLGHCGFILNNALDLGLLFQFEYDFSYLRLSSYSYLQEILRPPIA